MHTTKPIEEIGNMARLIVLSGDVPRRRFSIASDSVGLIDSSSRIQFGIISFLTHIRVCVKFRVTFQDASPFLTEKHKSQPFSEIIRISNLIKQ